ncbi:MAG: acyl carrier protein [Cyanobacteria bacterium J06627_28]
MTPSSESSQSDSQFQLTESAPLTINNIQDWIAEHVGEQIGVEVDEVDTHTPFHRYGLTSMQAMAIAQAGKQRFGIEISPLVLWNFPTIASLSEHISEELSSDERESFEI